MHADAAGPSPAQPRRRWSRRTRSLAAAGATAYLVALLGTLPAAVALPHAAGVATLDGTLWRGGATLIDGSRLTWRWAPLRSLWVFGLAADWEVGGRGTALAGRATLRRRLALETAHGTAGGALLAVMAPGLPFACDVPLRIALDRPAYGGALPAGEIRSGPGLCAAKAAAKTGGGAVPVPALAATLAGGGERTAIAIAPAGQPHRLLATGTFDAAAGLALEPTLAGAAAFPFATPPAAP